MPEEAKDVQQAGEQESKGLPVPEISGGSSAESSSAGAVDIKTLVSQIKEELVKELPDLVDARFKSGKDKRFSKLESLTSEFETMKRYLDAANGDAAQAVRNMQLDRLLEGTEAQIEDRGKSSGGQNVPKEEVTRSAMDVLKKYGLSIADPEVVQLAFKQYNNGLQEYLDELEAIGRARTKQTLSENIPASAVQNEGGGFKPVDSYEALQRAYNEELSNLPKGLNYVEGKRLLIDKYIALAKERGIQLPG